MIVDITKLVNDNKRFLKQINNLSLAEAEKLRDSGKVTGINFDSLCNYIGKKMVARKPMHWLAISQKKKTHREFRTRIKALEHLENNFPMTKLQADKLYRSGVVKVPHKGVIEVVSCDCQDGKHTDEIY